MGGGLVGGDLWGSPRSKHNPHNVHVGFAQILKKAKAYMILLDIGTCKIS